MPDGLCSVSGLGVSSTASSARWKMERLQCGFRGCFGKELLRSGRRSSLVRHCSREQKADRDKHPPPPAFQSLECPLVVEPIRDAGKAEIAVCRRKVVCRFEAKEKRWGAQHHRVIASCWRPRCPLAEKSSC